MRYCGDVEEHKTLADMSTYAMNLLSSRNTTDTQHDTTIQLRDQVINRWRQVRRYFL